MTVWATVASAASVSLHDPLHLLLPLLLPLLLLPLLLQQNQRINSTSSTSSRARYNNSASIHPTDSLLNTYSSAPDYGPSCAGVLPQQRTELLQLNRTCRQQGRGHCSRFDRDGSVHKWNRVHLVTIKHVKQTHTPVSVLVHSPVSGGSRGDVIHRWGPTSTPVHCFTEHTSHKRADSQRFCSRGARCSHIPACTCRLRDSRGVFDLCHCTSSSGGASHQWVCQLYTSTSQQENKISKNNLNLKCD